ncbi:MAG: M20/M25/M40 family metallo-hydrolase [Parvularculaceae bacterium]
MHHLKIAALATVFALAATSTRASTPEEAVAAAKDWRASNGAEIVGEFANLLAAPNIAGGGMEVERNVKTIVHAYARRGFQMKRFEAEDASPLIYGAKDFPGATRTIAIYAHYDGQPVNEADWTNPPFKPTLYTRAISDGGDIIPLPDHGAAIDDDWRLYARSAGDDKAPIIALIAALDALEAKGITPNVNIRVVFDGEEEAGSPNLGKYLDDNKGFFSDINLWLFCDGPKHQSGRAQLVFGARGVTDMDITVYGPNRGLHSGHYGNWAPGPGWRLANLLASMKDVEGRVLIRDFYKGTKPVSAADRRAIEAMPPVDDALRAEFGLAETEMNNALLAERILLPALNLKGLKSAEVGEKARNVIPPTATASIGVRLAAGNDPAVMLDRIEKHITREGYFIVREEPDQAVRLAHPLIAKITRHGGYSAVRTPIDDPEIAPLTAALKKAAPDLILTPTLGGSLPLFLFTKVSDAPIVILPIANFDNNQHSADENIRLGDFFSGVEAYAAALVMVD